MALQDDSLENNFPNVVEESNAFTTPEPTQDYSRIKQDTVARASARKKQTLAPDRLPDSQEEFVLLNPNATQDDLNLYKSGKYNQDWSDVRAKQAAKDEERNRDRTYGELIQDAAIDVGVKFPLGVAKTAYGLADLASRALPGEQTLDSTVGGSKALNKVDAFWAAQMSDPTQYQVEQVAQQQQEYKLASPSSVEALPKNASALDKVVAYIEDIGGEAGNTIRALVDNPLAATDIILSSAPELIVSGGIGIAVKKVATKGMSKDQAADYVNSDAGRESISGISEAANLGYLAASESMNTAVAAKGKVLELSHEELMRTSEFYRAEITNGVSPEQARMNTSDRVFETTASIAAATALITAKATGAGRSEASGATGFTKQVATQGVEEPLQSAGSQFAENVATQQFIDKETGLTENIGEALGTGFVAGVGSSVVVPASIGAAQTAKEVPTIIKERVKQVKEASFIEDTIASGNTESVTDTKKDSYKPEIALEVLLDGKVIPESEEERSAHVDKVDKHISELLNQTVALHSKANTTTEEDQLVADNIVLINKYKEQRDALATSALTDIASDIETITKSTEQTPETDAAVKRVFGSMKLADDSVTIEQKEAIASSSALSEDQRGVVSNSIEVAKAKKTLTGVSTDIFEGGKGFLGINDHMASVTSALAENDIPTANKQVAQLKEFADRHTTKANELANSITDPTTAEATASKYGLDFVDERSTRLIEITGIEADALQAAVRQANHLINAGSTKVETTTVQAEVKSEPVKEDVAPKKKTKVEPAEDTIAADYAALTQDQKDAIKKATPKISGVLESRSEFSKISEGNKARLVKAIRKASKIEPTPAYSISTAITSDRNSSDTFKAKAVKDSANKLDTVKDFFSTAGKDSSVIGNLNKKQLAAFPNLSNHVKLFNRHFYGNVLKVKDVKFQHLDYMQAFLDSEGKLDNNMLATLATVSYNWLGTQASGTVYNDQRQINSILGRENDHEIAANEYTLFAKVGDVRTVLAESLGNEIVNKLGLSVDKDTSGEVLPNLAMSVGLYAIAVMDSMGLVTQSTVKATDFPGDPKGGNKFTSTGFVRVSTTIDSNSGVETVNATVQTLGENLRNSDNLLKALFDIDSSVVMPTLKPVEKGPTQVKRSTQKVTPEVTKILAAHNSRPQKIKGTVANVLFTLSDNIQQSIVGIKDPATVHISQRPGIEGKNASLLNELNNFQEFEAGLETSDTEFFFQHEVWKNNRVGMVGTFINTQSSKVHRHLVTNSDHVNIIDPSNPDELNQFKLAVAVSMGVGIDKLTVDESLRQYSELTSNPIVRNGVTAIKKVMDGQEATKDMEDKILAAVKLGGEDTYSLDGLVALAGASSTKEFETDLFMEVDGITNGVIIGLLQLNAGKDLADLQNMVAKGGVYADGVTTSFGEWKSNPDNLDSYEDMAKFWREELDKNTGAKVLIDNIEGLIGGINRGKAKGPLMTTVYGSSLRKVIELFTSDSLDKVYSDIAKANNDQAKLDDIARYINNIVGLRGNSAIRLDAGKAIDTEFSTNIKVGIGRAIENTYGKALEITIEEKFGTFIMKRTRINDAMDVVFNIFKGSYDSIIEQKEEAKGSPLNSTEKEAIVESLIDTMPILHNYFSKKTGNLNEATVLVKTKKNRQKGKAFKTEQVYANKLSNGNKSSTGFSSINDFEAPGVAPSIVAIHSLDAASMVSLMENHSILNVHDAFGSGIKESTEFASDFNKIFADIMKDYTIMDEMNETLQRSVKFMTKKFPNLESSVLDGIDEFDSVSDYASNFNELTIKEASEKAEFLDSVTYWTQYNIENGGYTPDASDTRVTDAVNEAVKDIKGSAPNSTNPNTFRPSVSTELDSAKTLNMFDQLGSKGNVAETNTHTAHLREVLTDTVNKVITPFTLHEKDINTGETYGMTTGDDVYLALSTAAQANGIQMSAQETYVHELVHNVTAYGVDSNSASSREIKRLFSQAEKVIKPVDLMSDPDLPKTDPNYSTEFAAAKLRYDYIFNNTDNSKVVTRDATTGLIHEVSRNNYLHEFVAIGLTNKQFIRALASKDVTGVETVTTDGSALGNLMRAFKTLINRVFEIITGTVGMKGDVRLQKLAQQIAGINHRKESLVMQVVDKVGAYHTVAANKLAGHVVQPLIKLAKSDAVTKSKSTVVRAAGLTIELLPTTEYKHFAAVMRRVRKRNSVMKKGLVASIITEAKGRTENNGTLHDLLRYKNKVIDQTRLATSTGVASHILDNFVGGSLTPEEKVAMTKVTLRTDLVALYDTYSYDDVSKFVKDSSALDKAISDIETKLNAFGKSRFFYKKQARNLGYFMVTGKSRESTVLLNAYNIANQFTTDIEPEGDVKSAEKLIDTLASLYAVSYTNKKQRKAVSDIMDREFSVDKESNGFTFTMQVHKETKSDSRKRLFKNQDALVVKGYVKEVFNPNTSFIIADYSEKEVLAKQGYRVSYDLSKDETDPNQDTQMIYISNDGLQGSYDAGVVSLTSRQAKGTNLVQVLGQIGDPTPYVTGQKDGADIYAKKALLARKMFTSADTRKEGETTLIPVMNPEGDVTGYRYMMNQANRDELLEQTNEFEILLGGMVASVEDKVNTVDVNDRVVRELHSIYRRDIKDDPTNFVRISSNSPDTRYKEIYDMLPREMKDTIKKVWGTNAMFVRHEDLDLVFGYRRMSIVGIDKSDEPEAVGLRKVMNTFNDGLSDFFNNRYVAVGENIFKEIVATAKDTIVVKSGSVLLGNVASNTVLLKTLGVPSIDAVKDQAFAVKHAIEHRKLSNRISRVERELKLNHGSKASRAKLAVELSRLKNDLANNPVNELVDAGIFQSIVEDATSLDSPYSYKSALGKYVDPITSRVPSPIKTLASNIFLTHDTATYQLLRDMTQVSDFASRYALHKYNTTRKESPLSKEESIKMIVETFINYDLPTHRGIQYANDIGAIMFTKFTIRAQKVIFHMIKNHPGNVLTLLALESMIGDAPDLMGDANLLTNSVNDKINLNPLDLVSEVVDVHGLDLLTGSD